MLYTACSVGVPDSILRQSAMAQSDYPNLSFPPRCTIAALCQPACTCRDPGEKPSGARVYYPPLRFPQSTLDDLGRNRGGLHPCFGLHGFSWHPPRDAKNCHALEIMCAWQQPHAVLSSVTPNMMHTDTDQKAQ